MKLLAILDDPEMMDGISFTLELRWPQLNLVSTREGSKGIEMVAAEFPDIALLDTMLPDMDGLDALSQIRAFSNVPVIVISDRSEEVERVRGLTLGADDYVVKPVGCLELSERVAALLRRTSPAVLVHHLTVTEDEPGLSSMEHESRCELADRLGKTPFEESLTEMPWEPLFPTASSFMPERPGCAPGANPEDGPYSWLILNILRHFEGFS